MTQELKNKIDRFSDELSAANVAFVIVVTVSGTSPRWWSNLHRFTEGASEAVKRALNECGQSIARRRGKGDSRIIVPPC